MVRIFLNNPQLLLKEIKEKSKISSIRKISYKLGLNYSNLKQSFRGKISFPENYFESLIKNFNLDENKWYNLIKIKDDNWGRRKGGAKIANLSQKEKNKMAERARRGKEKIIKRIKKNKDFYEFLGIMFGDGCISKVKQKRNNSEIYIINISGHKILDYKYHEEYIKPLIKRIFDKNCYIYRYKKNNGMYLRFKNKRIALELTKYGIPIGKKKNKIKLTKEMLNSNWNKQKSLIKGIFDTDGCIVAKKHEKFKYPQIIISLSDNKLIKQIYKILRNKNYPFEFRDRKGIRANEIRMRGIKNTTKWMGDIGSNNPKHVIKYKYWKKEGILPSKVNWADRLTW